MTIAARPSVLATVLAAAAFVSLSGRPVGVTAFVPPAPPLASRHDASCQHSGSRVVVVRRRRLGASERDDDCPEEGVVSSEVSLKTFIANVMTAKNSSPVVESADADVATIEQGSPPVDSDAAAEEAESEVARAREGAEKAAAVATKAEEAQRRTVEESLRVRAQKAEAELAKAKARVSELTVVAKEKARGGVRGLARKLFRRGEAAESAPARKNGEPEAEALRAGRQLSAEERIEEAASIEGEAATAMDAINLARTTTADAFEEAEDDLNEVDRTLESIRTMLTRAEVRQDAARSSLAEARAEANAGLKAAEAAAAVAIAQAERAESIITSAVAQGGVASPSVTLTAEASTNEISDQDQQESATEIDIASLSYDDVGYDLHEMSPPFIDENQCLVPGETIVRVEKAPENSRRIFAGIDIMASVDDVWKVLTNYEHLQDVVPNLVVNDVEELYEVLEEDLPPSNVPSDPSLPDEEQLEILSKRLRGAKLRQVGGAKVVGINFSARTLLEVREWPEGMPDFAHYEDEVYEGKSRNKRAKEGRGLELRRYRFPRPFSLSSLPYRCISMQSVEEDDGEFRMYQGVWRMQPLVGCAPPGEDAMRLTYAVEISPRPYLPVALVENRIARDLCKNLESIREFVS